MESQVLPGTFRLVTIRDAAKSSTLSRGFSGLSYLRCIGAIVRDSPDVLVVSLWRAYLVGLLVKIIRPNVKLVTFIHLPKSVHWIDLLFTIISSAVSSATWADSQRTASLRYTFSFKSKPRALSFVTKKIESNPFETIKPIFIFWGRLHRQKNLKRALVFFRVFIDLFPSDTAHFYIVGPNDGEQERLTDAIKTLRLDGRVTLAGPMEFREIQKFASKASFYLQTSDTEGMAMSVVEAMQLGLVPVVTPVGEIENYAENGRNSIWLRDNTETAKAVNFLLQNESAYCQIRTAAIETWEDVELFPDSFVASCRALFKEMQ